MDLAAQLQKGHSGLESLGNISFKIPGGLTFAPSYFQAIAIVLLLFLLVLTLGQLRRRFLGWQIKGIMPGVAFGFVIALILEGIIIVGGRTIITEIIGWKNAPKPIVNVLDAGRNQLITVLGVADAVPESVAKDVNLEGIMGQIDNLSSEDLEKLQSQVCTP